MVIRGTTVCLKSVTVITQFKTNTPLVPEETIRVQNTQEAINDFINKNVGYDVLSTVKSEHVSSYIHCVTGANIKGVKKLKEAIRNYESVISNCNKSHQFHLIVAKW